MQKRTFEPGIEQELAEARRLLAAGRRQEALAVALNLLQTTLGSLRQHLLALKSSLTKVQEGLAETEARPKDQQSPPVIAAKSGGPYLH